MTGGVPSEGEVIDGKYRVEGRLGQGGMGAVYRAVHLGTSRTVALKVIAPRLAREPEFLQRFQREAHACGRLRHPNIVDVTDFGVVEHGDGPLAYLVMEYLDGCTLADVLKDETRLPLAWCVDVLAQVASAVEEAHGHGILHRDLKPDNIWLEPNRRGGYTVKVLDFGLAKTAGRENPGETRETLLPGEHRLDAPGAGSPQGTDTESPTLARPLLDPSVHEDETRVRQATAKPGSGVTGPTELDDGATRAGSVVGTPAYMSPEQIQGLSLTPRSDVYSLGVIAYRMITGRPVFSGPTDEVLHAHVREAPRPIRELRPDLPQEAADLVMSTLAKDPDARPRGAVAFAEMFAARFETPLAFLHGALQVFVSHFGTWLRLSVLCLLPLLVVSLSIATFGLLHASGFADLAWLFERRSRGIVLLTLLTVGMSGLVAFGVVVVPPAMQVLAAPLRPVEIRFLMRRFAGRFRRWGRTILPFIAVLAGAAAWTVGASYVLGALVPETRPSYIRTLAPPLRALAGLLVFLLTVSVPFAAMHLFMRRSGGAKGLQFVSTVILVEGLEGRPAFERAAALYDHAGKALHRAQAGIVAGLWVCTLALVTALSMLVRSLGPGIGLAVVAPICSVLVVLAMPFPLLVGELIYLRARQASGEPLGRILDEFERLVLPASHWRLTHRDQLREQIDLTR